MSRPSSSPIPAVRVLHGRRRGKPLRKGQAARLETDLAGLSPGPVDPAANPERRPLDLGARFGDRAVWLEIGFGAGEHTVRLAAAHPEAAIIGAEPYINGVAALLGKIREAGVTNLAVHAGDVRDLFDVLPAASLARLFLLYPDPWPKRRHHRRRLVTPDYLRPLARAAAPGAELRIATDVGDYARQALEQVPVHGFAWRAERAADWRTPWAGWHPTRYEKKARAAGRVPVYLTFRRDMDAPADVR